MDIKVAATCLFLRVLDCDKPYTGLFSLLNWVIVGSENLIKYARKCCLQLAKAVNVDACCI